MRILFVTWDGPGLSYLQSLFLPIFVGLRSHGYHFDVLQFRWGDRAEAAAVARSCDQAGVGYRAVEVSRRAGPLGPFATALAGGRQIRRAVQAFGSELLMPRSVLPALATLAGQHAARLPVIYDSDGLEVDERVEFAGLPPTGAAYRLLRDAEAQMVRRARAVLVRTEAAAGVLHARAGAPVTPDHFFVVANGRDPAAFHPHTAEERARVRDELAVPQDAPLLVYAGTVGMRQKTTRMGEFALALRTLRPDARLLVLTGSPHEAHAELIGRLPALADMTSIARLPPNQVGRHLAAADAGAAFIHASFSTRAIAPIKLAEYLLCGLPVVGTAAVGDTAVAEVEGLFVDEGRGLAPAARWLVEQAMPQRDELRARAAELGRRRFSLDRSVEDYARALAAVRP